MMEREVRITALVDSTFDLSLKELRSFLDRECAGDPALRAEIERRILEHHTIGDPRHPLSTPTASLRAGDVVANRYRIVRLIGRGGMGEVYEARDLLLKEGVALKTVRADIAHDNTLLQRFQEEILLARKVTHPNVCRIFEVGVHPSVTPTVDIDRHSPSVERAPLLFFAMELLQGETLLARLARGPLSRAEAFPIATQLAEGLQAAHHAGIVHADFKSANVILVPSGGGVRAVITDFGVARLDPTRLSVDDTRTLIENVRLAGTLAYMSPEQLAGERITAASDLYSFGVVLFEMASGQRPFDDTDLIRFVMLKAAGRTVSIRDKVPGIDSRWEAAVNRCLQRDPRRRFASAADLAAWFRGGMWRPIRYWTPREWIRNSASATVVLLALIGSWSWANRPYRPVPAAQRLYETGVNALHSMTYETARQALEQAVRIDPAFALAHASLARAYDELDYTDRAKDSMLRAVAAAQESALTDADEVRLRAQQFMVSRDYERAAPLVREIEATARADERAAAALESGWLAQQMEHSDEAAAAFERALTIDPANAAARLRLGFLFGRRGGKDDLALQSFDEAARLYQTAGNSEGVTQTLMERANLLDRRNREREALPVIEQGLVVARTVGNRFQEIRLRFLQATAVRDLGDTARAADLVRETIDVALSENMDNLAANGLIDLGNIFLRTGNIDAAEPHFQRALDIARRGRVRRIEARALVSLGSLCEQDQRPEEARRFVEAGLAFYRQAGYQRESVQASIVLGGVLRQLGQLQQGIHVLEDALPGAIRLQDRPVEAQLRERLADHLRDRGDWPAAVTEYQRVIALYGAVVLAESTRVAFAQLLRRLGQREDAERALREAHRFATARNSRSLLAAVQTEQAAAAYADGGFAEAERITRQLASNRPPEPKDPIALLQSLVSIRTGRVRQGLTAATRVVDALKQARQSADAAAAQLATAEALVLVGEGRPAQEISEEALRYYEPRQIWEPVIRGHLIAARATQQTSNRDAHRAGAGAALARLRSAWGDATVNRYLERPDIRRLSQGVDVHP